MTANGRGVKIYAERPARIAAQVGGDLLLAAWCAGWVWIGLRLHDEIAALAAPTRRVGDASANLADALTGASDQVRGLQFIGDIVAAPFDAIVNGARELAAASASGQVTVARIADLAIPLTAVFPIVFGLTVWLALRGRWIRRASAMARLRRSGAGVPLLAGQALTFARLDRLVGLDLADDPLGDPVSRQRLAAFSLRRMGLRDHRV